MSMDVDRAVTCAFVQSNEYGHECICREPCRDDCFACHAWRQLHNVPYAPNGMTADKLRYIATSLDLMQKMLADFLPYLTVDGETPDPIDVETLREWLEGTTQQDDLRAWADDLARNQIPDVTSRDV